MELNDSLGLLKKEIGKIEKYIAELKILVEEFKIGWVYTNTPSKSLP